MSKPVFYPDWCTEIPVVNPISGQKNYDETVSPPIPVNKTQYGFNFKEFPPRQWLNLFFRWVGQWVRYLDSTMDAVISALGAFDLRLDAVEPVVAAMAAHTSDWSAPSIPVTGLTGGATCDLYGRKLVFGTSILRTYIQLHISCIAGTLDGTNNISFSAPALTVPVDFRPADDTMIPVMNLTVASATRIGMLLITHAGQILFGLQHTADNNFSWVSAWPSSGTIVISPLCVHYLI